MGETESRDGVREKGKEKEGVAWYRHTDLSCVWVRGHFGSSGREGVVRKVEIGDRGVEERKGCEKWRSACSLLWES